MISYWKELFLSFRVIRISLFFYFHPSTRLSGTSLVSVHVCIRNELSSAEMENKTDSFVSNTSLPNSSRMDVWCGGETVASLSVALFLGGNFRDRH